MDIELSTCYTPTTNNISTNRFIGVLLYTRLSIKVVTITAFD